MSERHLPESERATANQRLEGRGGGRWWRVVRQAAEDLWANNLLELAGSLAFYALLSMFPLLLAATAAATYVVEPAWAIDRMTALLEAFVPRQVVNADPIMRAALADRGEVGLLAIVTWLLAGRRILGALTRALNLISDVDPGEETWRRRLLVEGALLAGLVSLAIAALSAGALLSVFWEAAAQAERPPLVAAVVAVVHLGLLLAAFFAIYVLVPYGARNWRAALIGTTVATGLFLAARALFLLVVDMIWDRFNLIYGPLALGALLLLWAWYVSVAVLFGGSLASHIKVMLGEGHSAAEAERRHISQ